MTNSNDASTGNKRKLDDAGQSRPEKAQKVDHKVQTTLDDTVAAISDKKGGTRKSSSEGQTEKQDDDHPPEPEADPESSKGKTSEHETAVEPHGREGRMPSNILEKGTGRSASTSSSNSHPSGGATIAGALT